MSIKSGISYQQMIVFDSVSFQVDTTSILSIKYYLLEI